MFKIVFLCTSLGPALGCTTGAADGALPTDLAFEVQGPGDPSQHAAQDVAAAGHPLAQRSAREIVWLPQAVRDRVAAIDAVARTHGVDPRLVAIVMLVESRGDADAISPVGARGLMQIMPTTAAAVARAHALAQPTTQGLMNPAVNLQIGVLHLADLIAEFGDPMLDRATVYRVATAYNGGQGVVLGEREPSEETQHYAARVGALWNARDASNAPGLL